MTGRAMREPFPVVRPRSAATARWLFRHTNRSRSAWDFKLQRQTAERKAVSNTLITAIAGITTIDKRFSRARLGRIGHGPSIAEQPGGGHGERGGGCCNGPLIGNDDGAFTSDGFGGGTAAEPFLPYLSA